MGANNILIAMILVCLASIVLIVMSKPLKFILKVLINSVLGGIAITITNIALAPVTGTYIGVNLLTMLFTGLLGVPGYLGLLAMRFML